MTSRSRASSRSPVWRPPTCCDALAAGLDPNATKAGNDSLLCYASMYRQPAAASLLVEAGANVNHRGSCGRSPLHYAAMHPNMDVVRLLLDCGAKRRSFPRRATPAVDESRSHRPRR